MKSNETILKLINKNASVNEICSITGLSHKQLFYRMNMLKIKGYDFKKKYYYNGEIVYDLIKNINNESKENEATILTSNKTESLKVIMLSDLHFTNIDASPELLYEVYNFCIKKGIHIIFNTGDLIDGPVGCGDINKKKTTSVEEQVEFLLKKYPFDKNILNFICLGNHDHWCLKNEGINLHNILENKRHDLVSLGYGHCEVNIKNDKIILSHKIDDKTKKITPSPTSIILKGHSHFYKNSMSSSNYAINIPSLSNCSITDNNGTFKSLPSFLLANMEFTLGWIKEINLEQYIIIKGEICKISETQYHCLTGKPLNKNKILNEETRKSLSMGDLEKIVKKDDVKKLERKITSDMSQIEKFNVRFGK